MGLVLFSSVQWQGKRWRTQEFHLNRRKCYFIQWGWSNSGTGFPERVWSVSILGNIQRPTGRSCDQPASRWLWFVHGGWTGFSPREAVSPHMFYSAYNFIVVYLTIITHAKCLLMDIWIILFVDIIQHHWNGDAKVDLGKRKLKVKSKCSVILPYYLYFYLLR